MHTCKTCHRPKANFDCGLCQEHVCKSCAQFLGEDHFTFLRKVPAELKHSVYCSPCFDEKVSDTFEFYKETLEKAKEIIIFSKSQTKLTANLKRKEEAYKVEDCADQEEAIMKMSFYAVEDNFNALIDIQLKSKQVKVGSHKKAVWGARAVPITIDPNSIRSDDH